MKKTSKMLNVLVTILVIFCTLFILSITSSAASKTQDDAISWADSKIGSKLDKDGNGKWCVDLIYYYYEYLDVPVPRGSAKDFTYNALPEGWERIKYHEGMVPQEGDIAVWTYASGPSGHVAIVESATESRMSIVEQNRGGPVRSHSYRYSFGTLYGFIRPNFKNDASNSSNSFDSSFKGVYKNTSNEQLNIYTGTGTDYAIKASVPSGENVYVYEATGSSSNNWALVSYNSIKGYVQTDSLSKQEPNKNWVYENDNWQLFQNDTAVTGWKATDGFYYYFDENGNMTTDWKTIGNVWYYFNQSGDMVTGWNYINNNYYFFQNWGGMSTGWQYINGKWYYFKDNGHMATDWQYVDNNWYYLTENGDITKGWSYINGEWYYFKDWGGMATDWQWINGAYYYFSNSGAMVKGWNLINSTWYYFSNSGAMVKDWQYINDRWYYFQSWGGMTVGWQWDNGYYYFDESGSMISNTWKWIDGNCYYFYRNGSMARNRYINGSYVGSDGAWV